MAGATLFTVLMGSGFAFAVDSLRAVCWLRDQTAELLESTLAAFCFLLLFFFFFLISSTTSPSVSEAQVSF